METKGLFRLPAELRAEIWQLCLPAPRHIVIPQRSRRRVQTPTVFHICHESRSEAQRHFNLVAPTPEADWKGDEKIWIDFSRDTVCIEGEWILLFRSSALARNIQRLAFEFRAPQNFMQLLEILAPVHDSMGSFPSLREIVLYSLPKKWFEDHYGRVQERHPPLADSSAAAKILLRLLHMLFGGHAWLDSGAGIPPPLRWQFVENEECDVWTGPWPEQERYEYVFRCAATGRFEVQSMTREQLARLKRTESPEPRVHQLVGCYEGCPEHGAEMGTDISKHSKP